MEEDLTILKNHERCQHNLHELWDTIRTLRTFVETYELERNALRIQRDDAIADADRADAENVKLASSSNPQQKIKYLQQVKKDNQALRRKNRALNLRIAKQAAKYIREKNGCSLLEEGDTTIDTTLGSITLDDIYEHDECAVRTGEEILRCMRDRSEILEHRLERLRLARQELPEGDDSTSEDFHTIMPW
ncbi:E3 ubiquitin-protein ligase SlrP [Phytophthora nicotianae]|uniref:E3 ubiquitin-protein ligase SlrP n=1 Tax=Phytophthora nicotianae TaxID=4792 RepID=A0A0W8DBA2_PHYNI|nr:E3 ubiquitin-protein ligase SlrP [Phytophthora nicotianae]